ncbi:L,D-transpeptidase [Priestia megaterium]
MSQGCVRMHNADIEKLYDKAHRLLSLIPIRVSLILRVYMVTSLKATS